MFPPALAPLWSMALFITGGNFAHFFSRDSLQDAQEAFQAVYCQLELRSTCTLLCFFPHVSSCALLVRRQLSFLCTSQDHYILGTSDMEDKRTKWLFFYILYLNADFYRLTGWYKLVCAWMACIDLISACLTWLSSTLQDIWFCLDFEFGLAAGTKSEFGSGLSHLFMYWHYSSCGVCGKVL